MELVQCHQCKETFEADHTDLGTYACPYCMKRIGWKRQLDEAFKKLDAARKLPGVDSLDRSIIDSKRGDDTNHS